ncbi:tRNA (guanine-N1)-methyltransferase [Clostridium niameyense]|uniref:tRNA (Guanine-N1)-methyltransferase n=1 Tax=Clostridium niameyense TaxID=1622073 RepID=A0A6M0RB78_9CLOT|nr:tRNA (guanine-N1)-methyltransferase [Clostridium niameyense]
MAKPSIFSKDYERKMKKRKRRKFIGIIAIVLLGIFLMFNSTNLSNKLKAKLNEIKNETKAEEKMQAEEKNKQASKEKPKKDATVKKEEAPIQDKNVEVELESGVKIKIIYTEDDKKNKVIKNVDVNNNKLTYDINSNKSALTICNTNTQNMFVVDVNGNKQDITNKQYVSTTGQNFAKDAILSSNQGYIWSIDPKFIDNNNIAYISQLPWFNKTTKYIWIYNMENKNHIYVESGSGENIKFDKLTDKGLTVIVDGKTIYLKPDGSITQ